MVTSSNELNTQVEIRKYSRDHGFTHDEDIVLYQSFIDISQDSIVSPGKNK